jgi:hypothetical protein
MGKDSTRIIPVTTLYKSLYSWIDVAEKFPMALDLLHGKNKY